MRNSCAVAERCFVGGSVAGAKLRPRGIATTDDVSLCAGAPGRIQREGNGGVFWAGRHDDPFLGQPLRAEDANQSELGRGVDWLAQFV